MFIKKHSHLIIVSVLALVFFILSSFFIFLNQPRGYSQWSSPDETANYFFALKYSESGSLSFFDKAGIISDGWTVPRSLRSDFGFIKPVSFLGIILIYGSLASFLGTAVVPFLTPFFAALGIIIFYFLNRRLFNERVALWASFLLAAFPVYIYYSIRAMFHNVLFIVLFLAGLYFLSLVIRKKQVAGVKIFSKFFEFQITKERGQGFIAAFFGGLFIGLAVITRTSEILWLVPALFLLWLFYARRFGFLNLLLFLSGLSIALVPVAYYNQILYGSFLSSGYNELNRSVAEISRTGSAFLNLAVFLKADYWLELYHKLKNTIFYFGFKPEQSINMFKTYASGMFPLLFWPAALGLVLLFIQNLIRPKKKYFVYIICGLFITAFLVFYYGSWKFNDNPNPEAVTIGNSYTRYWLPIYLWLMPLASFLLVRITKALFSVGVFSRRLKETLAVGAQTTLVALFIFFSLAFVFFGSEEGLAYWFYNNVAERSSTDMAQSLTETNAVIITRYHDKFFWPARRVIVGSLPDEDIFKVVKKLINYYPIYYYNFYLDDKAVAYLNSSKLAPYNLKMTLLQKTNLKFALYQIEKVVLATSTPLTTVANSVPVTTTLELK
jgi:4-amino-4-deoxy-L-arabinose transferase-like glycosyltransferase